VALISLTMQTVMYGRYLRHKNEGRNNKVVWNVDHHTKS